VGYDDGEHGLDFLASKKTKNPHMGVFISPEVE
jgi:hypothetical protein